MKRALLTAVMATWPLGALGYTLPGADADDPQRTGNVVSRQADEPQGNAARGIARDETVRVSEPFYRYGHREPAMEEFAMKGDSPERGATAPKQPPH